MTDNGAWQNRIVRHGTQPASQFVAHPDNWRIHPQPQRDALSGVLDEVGWVDDVIVNVQTGFVVDGHERIWQALKNGDQDVPFKEVDLTPEEEAKILLTFDPISAMAATDAAKLDDLLAQVETGSAGLDVLLDSLRIEANLRDGHDAPEDAGARISEAEALQKKWKVKTGDMFEMNGHRLICGDCTDPAVVERVMDGKRAQMIITDPPYGVDYDGGTTKRRRLKGDKSPALYLPFLNLMKGVCVDSVALYLFYADGDASVTQAVTQAGFKVRNNLIWNKNLAQFGALSQQYKQKHEPFLYCYVKGKAPKWYGPTNEVTVWDIARSTKNNMHPTEKPVPLFERAIANSTLSNDILIDGFCGGGTTIIAAERLSRRARGIEIAPEYVAVSLQRYLDTTSVQPQRIDARSGVRRGA